MLLQTTEFESEVRRSLICPTRASHRSRRTCATVSLHHRVAWTRSLAHSRSESEVLQHLTTKVLTQSTSKAGSSQRQGPALAGFRRAGRSLSLWKPRWTTEDWQASTHRSPRLRGMATQGAGLEVDSADSFGKPRPFRFSLPIERSATCWTGTDCSQPSTKCQAKGAT